MTLLIPDGYAHVIHSLLLSGDSEPYAITYGIDTTVTDVAGANTIAGGLNSAYNTEINPTNSSLITLVETTVKVKVAGEPEPIVGVSTVPHPGAGGSTALVPQNTALLVHKRSGYGGRGGRGRMYFPGLNEANVDAAGNITVGWQATMNAALGTWLTTISGLADVGTMQILHDSGGASSTLPPRPVTALQCDALAATQRRRLRK